MHTPPSFFPFQQLIFLATECYIHIYCKRELASKPCLITTEQLPISNPQRPLCTICETFMNHIQSVYGLLCLFQQPRKRLNKNFPVFSLDYFGRSLLFYPFWVARNASGSPFFEPGCTGHRGSWLHGWPRGLFAALAAPGWERVVLARGWLLYGEGQEGADGSGEKTWLVSDMYLCIVYIIYVHIIYVQLYIYTHRYTHIIYI